MINSQRYPYKLINRRLGMSGHMPYLPLTLRTETASISVEGLLDTGASVNVLSYEVGLQLGLNWERETLSSSWRGI